MSPLSREEARRVVQEAGLRATAPRIAVLRLLALSKRPLSHSEVVDQIGTSDFDPATLYRNLIKLVEANLARVASTVGGVTRYEIREADEGPHLHPHFSCEECGLVHCLPGAILTGPVDRAWRHSLKDASLQLTGTCPECRRACR